MWTEDEKYHDNWYSSARVCRRLHCLYSRQRTAAAFIDFHTPHPLQKFTHWLCTLGWVFCATNYTLNILWIWSGTRLHCICNSASSFPAFAYLFLGKGSSGAQRRCCNTLWWISHLVQSGTAGGLMKCTSSCIFDRDIVPACLYLHSVQDPLLIFTLAIC